MRKVLVLILGFLVCTIAAHAQWVKFQEKDAITGKTDVGFSAVSQPPEKGVLTIVCPTPVKYGVALEPHFQVKQSAGEGWAASRMRMDDVVVDKTTVRVSGDLSRIVFFQLEDEKKIRSARKEIVVELTEFGGAVHQITFKLDGPGPSCPE